MKRFLRKVGLLTAAITMMLSSGVAVADQDGSVALNKWLRKAPTDNGTNVTELTATSNRIQRNQTLYFVVVDEDLPGTAPKTVQGGALVACDVTSPTTGCASAPLFIASTTAMICLDEDMADDTSGALSVFTYICEDSSCTRATSIQGGIGQASLSGGPAAGKCLEFGAYDGGGYDSFNVGGSWVYVDVSVAPDDGETALIWITAN